MAHEADLVIGVGTRWSDFTTSSHSVFQSPEVRFINVNVAPSDAGKLSGLPVLGDARTVLEELAVALQGHRVDRAWEQRASEQAAQWASEVTRLTAAGGPLTQAQVIGAINDAAAQDGVVVCAAGSAPGELHKLWRASDQAGKSYHVEYGYSCMGYEIPGGIGVKLAAPERDVFVLVGDGSYLMLPGELVTAVAEGIRIVVVLVDNHGYASIGALSRSVGSAGFGTHYRRSLNGRPPLDDRDGAGLAEPAEALPIDLAANALSLGAQVLRAGTVEEMRAALVQARAVDGPAVVYVETDRYASVPSYESWWDVPVAEVSEQPDVRDAREEYERARRAQRSYVDPV
jgi:3D-(3,5/4)-trihydroxycyclohexane-1,2-dione acylhydrolase (decyclizing)